MRLFQVNMSFTKITLQIAGVLMAIAVAILVSVVPFDVVSQGEGVLAINDSNVSIYSPSSGIIGEVYVTRGDEVTEGMPLMLIVNIEDENRRDLLTFNADLYAEQVQTLATELQILKRILIRGKILTKEEMGQLDSLKLLKVTGKFDAYLQQKKDLAEKKVRSKEKQTSLNQQKELLQNKSSMIQEALGSTVRYLDSRLEIEKVNVQMVESKLALETAESEVESAYVDFMQFTLDLTEQTQNEYEQSIEMLQTTRSDLNTVNERILSTEINSTVNGTVLSIKDGLSEGTYIERNTDIMTLKRDNDGVYVDAQFDSTLRPYLTIGASQNQN